MGQVISPQPQPQLQLRNLPWPWWQVIATYGSLAECLKLARCSHKFFRKHSEEPLHPAVFFLDELFANKDELLALRLFHESNLGKWVYLERVEFGRFPQGCRVFDVLQVARLKEFMWLSQEVPASLLPKQSVKLVYDPARSGWLEVNRVQVCETFSVDWLIPAFAKNLVPVEGNGFLASPSFRCAGHTWLSKAWKWGLHVQFGITVVHPTDSALDIVHRSNSAFRFGPWMFPGPFDRGWHKIALWETVEKCGFLNHGTIRVRMELNPTDSS